MKHKIAYLVFSALILVPGIFFLLFSGLNLSIDFTGGSVFRYQKTDALQEEVIRSTLNTMGIEVESVRIDQNEVLIRTKPVDSSQINSVKSKMAAQFSDPKLLSFETVGPTVGRETTKNAFVALIWASVGILLYIAYAFRNVPKPYSSFRFGASAIVAMLHDAFAVLGIFAILGHFFEIEVDGLFITALLTIIGFSVHDTIVVFDRIRENLGKLPTSWSFESVVNYSVAETLNRSIATSLTVVMTLLSLYLLGGQTIKVFVLAMLIGIISGTYSSIFTASPILVIWEEYILRRRRK
ncbi:protein translocase subunit SecF [candidate division WWE3 bacterium]|uniref:Protein-export membrane protein SecF n=1 Tax=candidate division WWE3 bacterium TaxID=2053526 RepID=A0A7X9HGI1_UNCKA|nr:protein translocase subunit SecF [candidate division WWE3 bacterium]